MRAAAARRGAPHQNQRLSGPESKYMYIQKVGGLVVVLFDPLGRKLLNISQTGRHISIEKEKEITLELPVKLLLLGIFLRDMPNSEWSFKRSNWLVERSGDKKILKHANRTVIRLTEVNSPLEKLPENIFENQKISSLYYHDLDLDVEITRLEKQKL